MSRYAARKDANAHHIVQALRSIGAKVHMLDGKGIGDLLVGFRGQLSVLECKDGSLAPSRKRLRKTQEDFFREWQGYRIYKVESIEEALKVIGAVK